MFNTKAIIAAPACAAALLAAAAFPASAQPREAVVTTITAAEAPVIDGDLSDAAWAKAKVIDDFRQFDPKAGEPMTERTVVRILQDETTLYVSFYAYDSDSAGIRATVMARDGGLAVDDFVRLYLDPFTTRRDGFGFEMGPTGARFDAIIENNQTILADWDTLWEGKARIVSDGWIAEMAIPFRSLPFDPKTTSWGFDLYRMIRRKNERGRWAQITPELWAGDISQTGNLTGLAPRQTGIGLDVQGYLTGRVKQEWQRPREFDATIEPSGNLYYKVTPTLTGTLTFNTDFSDTPLDERRVNTGRFSLFFPETRDFFLQDAAVFEFGGRPLNNNVNGRPFFSRNIGLVGGAPVDIIAGGKLSGHLGGVGIGGLVVGTEGTGTTDGALLGVARVTVPVLEQSEAGFIFTSGDPTSRTQNTVTGADFQYRSTTLIPGKTVQADAYYVRSFSSTRGEDDSFGIELAFPNEPWNARLQAKEVGENYFPALGFVNRPGIRSYFGEVKHIQRFQDRWVRILEFGTWMDIVTDLDNQLEDRENGAWVYVNTDAGHNLFANISNASENVTTGFTLPRNVPVAAGEYTWTNFYLDFESPAGRAFSIDLEFGCCSIYDGDYHRTFVAVNWRPSDTFGLSARHSFQDFNLPGGDVQIQIVAFDGTVNFTPDMQLRAQLQWDDVSRVFGASLRYRWEYAPGAEFFAAVGESAVADARHYESTVTQASIRIGHLIRL